MLEGCFTWCKSRNLIPGSQINRWCRSVLINSSSPYIPVASSCSALHAGKLCSSECDRAHETLSFWHACICPCTHCSSEQSAKAKTQKELFKTLKELKMHLPSEKRGKSKSSTVNTLKYALRCVKQVKGKTAFFGHFLCTRAETWNYLCFNPISLCLQPMRSITRCWWLMTVSH